MRATTGYRVVGARAGELLDEPVDSIKNLITTSLQTCLLFTCSHLFIAPNVVPNLVRNWTPTLDV